MVQLKLEKIGPDLFQRYSIKSDDLEKERLKFILDMITLNAKKLDLYDRVPEYYEILAKNGKSSHYPSVNSIIEMKGDKIFFLEFKKLLLPPLEKIINKHVDFHLYRKTRGDYTIGFSAHAPRFAIDRCRAIGNCVKFGHKIECVPESENFIKIRDSIFRNKNKVMIDKSDYYKILCLDALKSFLISPFIPQDGIKNTEIDEYTIFTKGSKDPLSGVYFAPMSQTNHLYSIMGKMIENLKLKEENFIAETKKNYGIKSYIEKLIRTRNAYKKDYLGLLLTAVGGNGNIYR